MKLIDYLKYKGSPYVIRRGYRDDLPQMFVDLGYKVGVEVGVYQGAFSEKLCQAGLKLYSVDPWVAFSGQGRAVLQQSHQDDNYELAKEKLSKYDCTIIRETSMDAVKKFRNRSIDFVYIDGDHTLPHIINDVWWWTPKVRAGGMVAGHDYYCTKTYARSKLVHVKPAVDVIAAVTGIENFWVLRVCRSWMWFRE